VSWRVAGFTLIELLVVLLIMGLALGGVSLSLSSGSQQRQLTHAAEQLARQSTLALQEAVADGSNRGLALLRNGRGHWSWQWYRQRQGQWQRLDSDPLAAPGFAASEFPPRTEAQLRVEDRVVPLAAGNRDDRQRIPDIVFYASGEVTPFSLVVSQSGVGATTLCSDVLGQMSVERAAKPRCQAAAS
jgi:general secretion pathway protein H